MVTNCTHRKRKLDRPKLSINGSEGKEHLEIKKRGDEYLNHAQLFHTSTNAAKLSKDLVILDLANSPRWPAVISTSYFT